MLLTKAGLLEAGVGCLKENTIVTNTSNHHVPGNKHAPGVKCIVQVILTDIELRLAAAIQLSEKELTADNGRIVVITKEVTDGYVCAGCGDPWTAGEIALMHRKGPVWEVHATDARPFTPGSSCSLRPNTIAVFLQRDLIPLGFDENLDADEKLVSLLSERLVGVTVGDVDKLPAE